MFSFIQAAVSRSVFGMQVSHLSSVWCLKREARMWISLTWDRPQKTGMKTSPFFPWELSWIWRGFIPPSLPHTKVWIILSCVCTLYLRWRFTVWSYLLQSPSLGPCWDTKNILEHKKHSWEHSSVTHCWLSLSHPLNKGRHKSVIGTDKGEELFLARQV